MAFTIQAGGHLGGIGIYTGQFANLVSSVLGRSIERLNRILGAPMQIDEILREIMLLNETGPPPSTEEIAIQRGESLQMSSNYR